MKIFYIEIDNFKKKHSKDSLIPYADRKFKTEKRFYEYTIGRYLIKTVSQHYYNIKDTSITINHNGKPFFKNYPIHFSISHSKNIVMACFDRHNCGIDIEYNKARNLRSLSEYFNEEFRTLEEFYKFWTLRESSIKLADSVEYQHFQKFNDNYYFTVVSNNKNTDSIELINLE